MQQTYDEFDKRHIEVIAVAQEDKDLASHARMRERFDPAPRFEIVADIDRQVTTSYRRVTSYAIDRSGTVRQVFPGTVRNRAAWHAILNELDRLQMD